MNNIWAPWRMKYITQKKKKGCVFCDIYREKKDKKNFVVLRSSHCFVLLNIFPYNNGHLMIVSNRHTCLEKLTKPESFDTHETLTKMIPILKKALKPDGFNIGINMGKFAGAGLEHLHIHLVPRWKEDTNFMPVLTDTKIISQSLKELYILLIKEVKMQNSKCKISS
ncbi:MAG: HIT domain-containing protein [Candidatus Omnitrophica bacterium]|nr:HIT domain-containing protein [Candidatus Omnitrophota bacterium]MBU1811252.1 HIT domain-containing protein [Candidatus Omnitrophota bacterium]